MRRGGAEIVFMIGIDPPRTRCVCERCSIFNMGVYDALGALKYEKIHVENAHSVENILWNIAFLRKFCRFHLAKVFRSASEKL